MKERKITRLTDVSKYAYLQICDCCAFEKLHLALNTSRFCLYHIMHGHNLDHCLTIKDFLGRAEGGK